MKKDSGIKVYRAPLKQETPAELVSELMASIRAAYCPTMSDKEWLSVNYQKVREWCVLNPAKFIVKKGFTLPADRFKAILIFVAVDAKRHATGPIRYLPAFLGKSVQDHFNIHWPEYWEEAKRLQAQADAVLFGAGKLKRVADGDVPDRAVETLAKALDVLTGNRKRLKAVAAVKAPKDEEQGSLF